MCLHGKRIEVIIISLEECRSTIIICDILKQCSVVSTNHFLCKYFRWISYTNMFYFSMFIKDDFSLFLTIFSLKLVLIGNKIYLSIKITQK